MCIASNHCVKNVRIRSYSVPHFPVFGPEQHQIRTLFTRWIYRKKYFAKSLTFNPYFTNIQIYCHVFQYCKAFAGQSWKASIKKKVPWCIVYHNRTSLYNTVCTKLRAGLNPARGVSELCDGENLLQ